MRISDWSSDVCSSDLAGQVWGGRDFDFAFELQHGVDRAVTGRAASAIGAGEEIRVVARQLAGSGDQFFMPSIGLRREELEAVAPVRSEEGRVGKECVSTCRSRWSPFH